MPFHDGQHGPLVPPPPPRKPAYPTYLIGPSSGSHRGWFHRMMIWLVTRQTRERRPW